MRVIKNGIVFTEGRFMEKIDVILEDGKILGLAYCLDSFDGEIIDARGKYVLPGFIDIHMHGIQGHDTMEGTEEAILIMAKALVQHGITGFLPTTMTYTVDGTRQVLAIIENLMGQETGGAVVLGCHMEGPFINAAYKGAQHEEHIFDPDLEKFYEMVGSAVKAVKHITVAPDRPGAESFIKSMKSMGISVSAGHTGAGYDMMQKAFRWGVSHVTHLFNGMNPLHHREPGVAGAALTHPGVTVEMIADLIHLHPAVLELIMKSKGCDRCILVSDSMMATGLGDGEYELGGQKVFVKEGQARLKEGNLAGSTLTLDKALKNVIERIRIAPEQAIPMVTSNPAAMIGEGGRRGRIAQGYQADLCIMDKEWTVSETVIKGNTCYRS